MVGGEKDGSRRVRGVNDLEELACTAAEHPPLGRVGIDVLTSPGRTALYIAPHAIG